MVEISMESFDNNELVLATTVPWLVLYKIIRRFATVPPFFNFAGIFVSLSLTLSLLIFVSISLALHIFVFHTNICMLRASKNF